MKLDEECKGCLYESQLKKVESTQTDAERLGVFKAKVKELCEYPPKNYCAPLLMRDINGVHRKVFGTDIDYSREKSEFNLALLALEDSLYKKIITSPDPVGRALSFAAAANYIDYARMSKLGPDSIDVVMKAAERAVPDEATLEKFKIRLRTAKTLLYLHDNCGEIVLDKILIRTIKKLYPDIKFTSVVRGKPIINDVTEADAREVGLYEVAEVIQNGADVPGTYLKEVSPRVLSLLKSCDVIISKGLGNLETLYGEGYSVFYAFNCKCRHIAEKFACPMWSAAFVCENA